MSRWRHPLALLAVAAVVLGVSWLTGPRSVAGDPGRPASLDAVRLGPEPGAAVADYLAALPARLPPAGGPRVPALVQFREGWDGEATAGVLSGVVPTRAVFRVALPRVQTALRFVPLPPVDEPDPAMALRRRFALAQREAQREAASAAARLTGRAGQVARYEAAALSSGSCRCVLAVLVVGDRPELIRLAGLPEVRAVDAAPEGTPPAGVALSPLLPEQTEVAGPMPDDGSIPGSAPG